MSTCCGVGLVILHDWFVWFPGVTANRLLMRTSDADMEQVMQTNLQGSIRCCQAVSKGMTKNRNGTRLALQCVVVCHAELCARAGVIINVGSVVGAQGNRGQTVYSASKAGLHGEEQLCRVQKIILIVDEVTSLLSMYLCWVVSRVNNISCERAWEPKRAREHG
mgnify:CR=1 FL=1